MRAGTGEIGVCEVSDAVPRMAVDSGRRTMAIGSNVSRVHSESQSISETVASMVDVFSAM